ncbi:MULTISPECIES: alternate-type signal peptide domain-containing protein [unclassified Leucobacter]|uniref:alternate-type signal peptide domain-containing protein n=1 Tax=unclassified Leucobacter TaxID=2621730 RepID=UPI003019C340
MNKMRKGLLVGAAGLVLLVGGAGSLALWNGSASVDAGGISSGVMSISAEDGTWSQDTGLWVPGDTSTYTTEVSITLAGDNLTTQLEIDPDSITGDPELLDALDVQLAVGAVSGGTVTPVPGQPNKYTVTSSTPLVETVLTVPVTVTVDFPEASVTGLDAQNQSVDLGGLAFALTQQTV